MTLDRMKVSAQTVRDNIAILEQLEEPDDAGYYLQLEHEKFVLECVEKQIPKKPIKINEEYSEITREFEVEYECASCGNPYIDNSYCSCCGQALDWGDTEVIDLEKEINRLKADVERLEKEAFTYKIRWAKAEVRENKAKAEARKEFAERLKELLGVKKFGLIDNLLEEMESESNE